MRINRNKWTVRQIDREIKEKKLKNRKRQRERERKRKIESISIVQANNSILESNSIGTDTCCPYYVIRPSIWLCTLALAWFLAAPKYITHDLRPYFLQITRDHFERDLIVLELHERWSFVRDNQSCVWFCFSFYNISIVF